MDEDARSVYVAGTPNKLRSQSGEKYRLLKNSASNHTLHGYRGRENNTSMGGSYITEAWIQQSQDRIELKLKDDYLRVQKMIKKRAEKDAKVEENIRNNTEIRLYKASLLNDKGKAALEKVRKMQKKIEIEGYKQYKNQIKDLEERTLQVQR